MDENNGMLIITVSTGTIKYAQQKETREALHTRLYNRKQGIGIHQKALHICSLHILLGTSQSFCFIKALLTATRFCCRIYAAVILPLGFKDRKARYKRTLCSSTCTAALCFWKSSSRGHQLKNREVDPIGGRLRKPQAEKSNSQATVRARTALPRSSPSVEIFSMAAWTSPAVNLAMATKASSKGGLVASAEPLRTGEPEKQR